MVIMPTADGPAYPAFRVERVIHVRDRHGGQESCGPLVVGPVVWMADRGKWACYYSVHVIDPKGHRLYGDDPIQAVHRALEFLGQFIRGSIEDGFGMWWQYEGDACGFAAGP